MWIQSRLYEAKNKTNYLQIWDFIDFYQTILPLSKYETFK